MSQVSLIFHCFNHPPPFLREAREIPTLSSVADNMALFQVGAPVEVEFNGKWFPATVNKEVDSGFRVQFDSDHSSTVILMEEVPTRVRGRNLPVSAMEDSVMALSTTASQEPDSLTSAIPERNFPSTILSKKTSSASATVQENTSTASIVPHLEALVSALQARAPSKAKTTLGIHLADSISDDDNDDDEEIDGPDDDGDNGPSGGDERSVSISPICSLAPFFFLNTHVPRPFIYQQ